MIYIHEEKGEMTEDDILDYLMNEVFTDSYVEDFIDEMYCDTEIRICGVTFSPGRIVRELDSILFITVIDDLIDGTLRDLKAGNFDYGFIGVKECDD